MTLGKYPLVSAPDARAEATKVLAKARLGHDPAGALKEPRQAMTMAQLVSLYEEEGCVIQRGMRQGEPMKDATKAYTLARLRHHVVPLLGTKVCSLHLAQKSEAAASSTRKSRSGAG